MPFWAVPVCVVIAATTTLLAARLAFSITDLPAEELRALRVVYHQIQAEYVEPVDGRELMLAAIEGMVDHLDEHSAFIPPEEAKEFDEDTTGHYEGIGIVMVPERVPLTVLFPFPDGPAARAGLRVGDEILAVDGERIDQVSKEAILEEARKRLLGPPGTSVTLSVRRGQEATFEAVVERGEVQRPSVKWARSLESGIGYVYVERFQEHTTDELDRALERLRAAGGLRGLVLDLRFDRGGLLGQAVRLANRFVPRGVIVSLKRRGNQELRRYEADPKECRHPDLALVLLVNGGSASASEVVAGALQDHARATLVGTRTYGKGVVQSIFRWPELDFRLKLTTAHYYTPNGRNIERSMRRKEDGPAPGGIAPDVEVKVDHETEVAIHAALASWEAPPAYAADVRELCRRLGIEYREPLPPAKDPQLRAALDELKGSRPPGDRRAGSSPNGAAVSPERKGR